MKSAGAILGGLLSTAVPLIIGQLGQMAMILIDMYFVGQLGPGAISGVGLGNAFFYVFGLFSAGVLFGLDYFVSHAQGRSDAADCHRWLWQGCWLSLVMSVPLMAFIYLAIPPYMTATFPPGVAGPSIEFLKPLTFCMPGFLIFITFRQYLQATGSVTAGTVITSAAIGSNIFFNWLLVFGKLGAPMLGVGGSGWATTITRTLMAGVIVLYTFHRDARLGLGLAASRKRLEPGALWALTRMGVPIGLQYALESGVFSLATALISRFGVVSAASHTIVLNVASFTYTVPTAIAGATAILVGQALGRGDAREARRTGWISAGLAVSVMAVSGLTLGLLGSHIAQLFTSDSQVIEVCARLIIMAAVFQVADGVQAVGGGALRGVGETRSSMVANLVGYWCIGLPLAYLFGERMGQGVFGFWLGLTVGLYAVAALILYRWVHHD